MANNPYVNKVVFGNNTVMDISGDTATPSDVLSGATFHDKSGALQVGTLSLDEFATIDLLKDTVGWTGKNKFKLPSNISSTTVGGVTFTVIRNSDGQIESIKANGTNTSGDNVIFQLGEFKLDGINNFIVSGTPDTSQNYGLRVGVRTSESDDFGNTFLFTEKGVEQIIPANTSAPYGVYVCIIIYQGKSPNNVLFKPMIRKASIADATYEPYHESVEQCKFDRAEQRVLGAKNLFNYQVLTATSNTSLTINNNGREISVETTSDGTYKAGRGLVNVEPNKDYIISCSASITSGTAAVSVSTSGGTEIAKSERITTSGQLELRFNSGNNSQVRIFLYCTWSTSEAGNVTYNDVMLRLASDPDDTYVPYAMTNKELTDSLDGWTATSQVANGEVSFSGLDDTQGWGYFPCFWVDGNSTNLNPVATIKTISGAGTASMSVTYETDADNGASCKLRIEK